MPARPHAEDGDRYFRQRPSVPLEQSACVPMPSPPVERSTEHNPVVATHILDLPRRQQLDREVTLAQYRRNRLGDLPRRPTLRPVPNDDRPNHSSPLQASIGDFGRRRHQGTRGSSFHNCTHSTPLRSRPTTLDDRAALPSSRNRRDERRGRASERNSLTKDPRTGDRSDGTPPGTADLGQPQAAPGRPSATGALSAGAAWVAASGSYGVRCVLKKETIRRRASWAEASW